MSAMTYLLRICRQLHPRRPTYRFITSTLIQLSPNIDNDGIVSSSSDNARHVQSCMSADDAEIRHIEHYEYFEDTDTRDTEKQKFFEPCSDVGMKRQAPHNAASLFSLRPCNNQSNPPPRGESARFRMETTKLSQHCSPDTLFLDCLDDIRKVRRLAETHHVPKTSDSITELTQAEKRIVHAVLKRVSPSNSIKLDPKEMGGYIDPYWNPFPELGSTKKSIHEEFTAYAKLTSVAEALKQKDILINRYRCIYGLNSPLSGIKERSRSTTNIPHDPKYPVFHLGIKEQQWDPSALRRQALHNNNRPIVWRDLHILKYFISECGMVMPRRLTMATRRQQVRLFKAIATARRMGVFPADWRPEDSEQMRMEDPLQFMTDVLTTRYKATGNLRDQAMIKAIRQRTYGLDTRRYRIHEANMKAARNQTAKQRSQELAGDFSQIVQQYSEATTCEP